MPESSHKNESPSCKNQKGNGNISASEKKNNSGELLLANILLGDFRVVKRIFYWMYGKGYFKNMKNKLNKYEIQLWVDDLTQEVSIALNKKFMEGTEIVNLQAYIRKIILYQSLDEDKRIGRAEPIDNYEY